MIPKKKRDIIIARDGERCVACGAVWQLTIHHRINRGAGGSKLFDEFQHLLTVCNPCNVSFESSAEVAEMARSLGYKLSRNANPAVDATQVPVYYQYLSTWYHLDANGEKREKE
jgi:5-methylcytosine-specific restriction endonuclease McrA